MILRRLTLTVCTLLVAASGAWAQETADFFRQNCVSCHTIGGGRLTGPDLKNIDDRQDRNWLVRWMLNPRAVIDSGDPYAQDMLSEARQSVMPTISGMTEARAENLLDLIAEESALEESQFKGLQLSDRPFTERDVERGQALFTGNTPFTNGGTPCFSCHTIPGLSGLGGGRLGPELTGAFERLGGRRNMGAWLYAPATPTMAPLFRDHALEEEEILVLLAVFESAALAPEEDGSADVLSFLLLAFGGTVLALVVCDRIWKRRSLQVRAPMVERRSGLR
jgi:mono/diheme cytochrome c family protein